MDSDNDIVTAKKGIVWIVLLIVFVSIGAFVLQRVVSTADTAVLRYEEFQEIYNTARKLDTDLCQMNAADPADPMFAQFSKQQRLLAMRATLNRWVEEYNAKSRVWTRSVWKSSGLPYELTVEQFRCYAGNINRSTP